MFLARNLGCSPWKREQPQRRATQSDSWPVGLVTCWHGFQGWGRVRDHVEFLLGQHLHRLASACVAFMCTTVAEIIAHVKRFHKWMIQYIYSNTQMPHNGSKMIKMVLKCGYSQWKSNHNSVLCVCSSFLFSAPSPFVDLSSSAIYLPESFFLCATYSTVCLRCSFETRNCFGSPKNEA